MGDDSRLRIGRRLRLVTLAVLTSWHALQLRIGRRLRLVTLMVRLLAILSTLRIGRRLRLVTLDVVGGDLFQRQVRLFCSALIGGLVQF